MNFEFNKKLFFYLVLGFIISTIVGTLSHEFGHYFVARILGFNARINYNSTRYFQTNLSIKNTSFIQFIITLGGPIQTIFTSFFSILFIWFHRSDFTISVELNFKQWVWIFLSLFSLRQTMNFAMNLIDFIRSGLWNYSSDEFKIESFLKLPFNSISILSAFLGAIVLLWISFEIIPIRQRFTFFCSGLVGGGLGYYIWLESLGKLIIP